MIKIKSDSQIKIMRQGGQILKAALLAGRSLVSPGVSLKKIDNIIHQAIVKAGAKPAFLNYKPEGASEPYPAASCVSVNDTIVHGLPDDYTLQEGDIVSLDAGVLFRGFCTDSAITIPVGKVSNDAARLLIATQEALSAGIKSAVVGNTIGDIGYQIESVADKYDLHIIEMLTGHGIGRELHEDPSVYNFGSPGEGTKLIPGMVLAIEPMFSLSSPDIISNQKGEYKTKDGSLSAQFEHTIAITKTKPLILTK